MHLNAASAGRLLCCCFCRFFCFFCSGCDVACLLCDRVGCGAAGYDDFSYGVAAQSVAAVNSAGNFSCCIQGVIPYGAQLLMASGLAAISPTSIIPYLFYPFLLCLSALVAILVGFPKFRAAKACAGA